MKLQRLEAPEVELVAQWLTQKENWQWLDFGEGRQTLDRVTLRVMAQRDIHMLRVFTPDASNAPIGVVGLSDINPYFKTATLWYVLGDKSQARRGYATQAVATMLTLGFSEGGLKAINAWVVEPNLPSRRVLERNHFQFVGRLRRCHYIDGQPYDRLLFDLLEEEHLVSRCS